jgi:hypothetical protein
VDNKVNNLSLVLQALSLMILFQDYNNVDLMQELKTQDNNYLNKIIEQNNKIIKLLESGKNEQGNT